MKKSIVMLAGLIGVAHAADYAPIDAYTYGPRPFYLIDDLEDGTLKDELMACSGQTPERSMFSIAHRGAPLQFPEHTRESYLAAARMGAGIIECDVAFIRSRDLSACCPVVVLDAKADQLTDLHQSGASITSGDVLFGVL